MYARGIYGTYRLVHLNDDILVGVQYSGRGNPHFKVFVFMRILFWRKRSLALLCPLLAVLVPFVNVFLPLLADFRPSIACHKHERIRAPRQIAQRVGIKTAHLHLQTVGSMRECRIGNPIGQGVVLLTCFKHKA